MWLGAADGASELDTALITAVWAFLGIVVTTLGTVAVQAMRGRRDTSSTTTTVAEGGPGLLGIAKDIGQLDQRADDSDSRDDVQDRRLNALERYNDYRDPDWRQR